MKSTTDIKKIWILVMGVCVFFVGAYSKKNDDNLLIFHGLISTVAAVEDSVAEVPEDLLDLVSVYYAEAVTPKNVTSDVLSYLTGIYSEHGYNEYGSWVPVPDITSPNQSKSSTNYRQSKFSTYKLPPGFQFPTYNLGDFKMPVNGSYTSFYGYRPKFGRFHKGIDISLKVGDTVRSVLPGVVVRIKCDPNGYGNYVVISHDGELETLYAHLTRELVVSGQRLNAGDAVGLGGTTGNATGPHLHFETRVKGEAIDPLYYLPKKVARK